MISRNIETKVPRFGLFSKLILSISLLFYFLSFLNHNFNSTYSNIPLFTINWYEFWRLATGPFISENLLILSFKLISIITIFNYNENRKGTMKFLIYLICHSLFYQIVCLIVCYTLDLFLPTTLMIHSIKTFSSMGLALLIQNIILTNNRVISCLFINEINNRFLFFIFVFSMILLSFLGELKLEIIVSIFYGLFLCKFKDMFSFADQYISLLEKGETFKFLLNFESYIQVDESLFKRPSSIHEIVCETSIGSDMENGIDNKFENDEKNNDNKLEFSSGRKATDEHLDNHESEDLDYLKLDGDISNHN